MKFKRQKYVDVSIINKAFDKINLKFNKYTIDEPFF